MTAKLGHAGFKGNPRTRGILFEDHGHYAAYQRLMEKLVEKDRDARFRNADEVIGYLSRKFYQGTGAIGAETTVRLG